MKGRHIQPAKTYAERAAAAGKNLPPRPYTGPATDVWIAPSEGRVYDVIVDGKVYDTMVLNHGFPRLTNSEMVDIAAGYREALNSG